MPTPARSCSASANAASPTSSAASSRPSELRTRASRLPIVILIEGIARHRRGSPRFGQYNVGLQRLPGPVQHAAECGLQFDQRTRAARRHRRTHRLVQRECALGRQAVGHGGAGETGCLRQFGAVEQFALRALRTERIDQALRRLHRGLKRARVDLLRGARHRQQQPLARCARQCIGGVERAACLRVAIAPAPAARGIAPGQQRGGARCLARRTAARQRVRRRLEVARRLQHLPAAARLLGRAQPP
ncbi:MAG: hypothetical protein U5L03_02235 [Burkholderiaceae bacterium]|nr:hypothetical protein [Burkholderiaceae bacterium]